MTIVAELNNNILSLTLNRPDKKNALTHDMYHQLNQQLLSAKNDQNVKVVLLTGSAECFTAGNDLQDFASSPLSESPVMAFLETLSRFPKIVVAAVSGPAVGIGTTMLLHCDYVLATDTSHFQMPFTRLGLCPEAGSSLLITHKLGQRVATELLILGKAFNAQRAQSLGIVNDVVDNAVLHESALAVCAQFCALPQQATLASKSLIQRSFGESLSAHMQEEARMFAELLQSDDCQAAIASFLHPKVK